MSPDTASLDIKRLSKEMKMEIQLKELEGRGSVK